MLEIEDYAFPFGLCFSRPIMLKIMLAYCINAYSLASGQLTARMELPFRGKCNLLFFKHSLYQCSQQARESDGGLLLSCLK